VEQAMLNLGICGFIVILILIVVYYRPFLRNRRLLVIYIGSILTVIGVCAVTLESFCRDDIVIESPTFNCSLTNNASNSDLRLDNKHEGFNGRFHIRPNEGGFTKLKLAENPKTISVWAGLYMKDKCRLLRVADHASWALDLIWDGKELRPERGEASGPVFSTFHMDGLLRWTWRIKRASPNALTLEIEFSYSAYPEAEKFSDRVLSMKVEVDNRPFEKGSNIEGE
jgi:hypothetical protein